MGLLIIGIVLVMVALVVIVLATVVGSNESTGVARSLELLDQRPHTKEVGEERARGPGPAPAARCSDRMRGAGRPDLARRAPGAGSRGRSTGPETPRRGPSSGSWAPRASAWSSAWCSRCCSWASRHGLLVAAGAGAAGFFLPDLLLYNAGTKRQQELQKGLADALDMLTVCVEAGQGFDAAILQVARSVDRADRR